jgi:hypothetical protein
MTYDEIADLWLSVAAGTTYSTVSWANLMAAIAMAESTGNPDAINPDDNNGTQTSWGLWQISLGNHNPPSPEWNVPSANAQLAIGKLETQGLACWGTYDSGAYKQYLQDYVPPSGPPPVQAPSAVRSSRQVAPVVTWGPDSLHAFAAAADGSVEYRAWNGNSWNDWVNLGGTVGPACPMPVPVAWGVNHLDVFYAGPDGNVYHQGWGGSSWNAAWDNLGNSGEPVASAPLAVSQQENSLDVFYMGPYHHTIWQRPWRGSWGDWASLGEIDTAADSTLTVCTWGAGRLDVCAVGASKTVMHNSWDGSAWAGSWADIGGNPAYDPALVSWGQQRLDVFIVGTDGNLWHNSWNGGWLGWQNMGNPGNKFSSAPFAVCQDENMIDVFVMGEYLQTIWHQSWNGESWSGWGSLGAIVSSASAKAAVATWAPGRLDAFTQVAPSNVYHSNWGGGAWTGGWEDLDGDVKFF